MSDRSSQIIDYVKHLFFVACENASGGIFAAVGITIPAMLFGVDSKFIVVLGVLYLSDFFTGLIKAVATGEKISSRRAFDSIIKGLMYFLFIIASWSLTFIFPDYLKLHSLAVTFTILIEFRSVLENIRDSKVNFPILSPLLDFVDRKTEAFVNILKKK